MEELIDWLNDFISKFREEYQKLSTKEQSAISNLNNFFPPCQIEAIWVIKPEFQIFIITNFQDKNDLEITIHGPIEDVYEGLDILEQILKDPKWNRELSKEEPRLFLDEKRIFRTILEGFFVNTINNIKKSKFSESSEPSISKSYLTKESSGWIIRGNILRKKPIELVNEIIKEAKETSKIDFRPETHPLPGITGHGTYFYPPIWIGEIPKPTLHERFTGIPMMIFSEKILGIEYKKYKIVIEKDGFIAIGIEDKVKAIETLNEIMATALLFNIPAFAIREHELGKAQIDPENMRIISCGWYLDTMRGKLSEKRWKELSEFEIKTTRINVSEDEIIHVIKEAERITSNPEIREYLTFLLEAYAHLKGHEYTQSFIMSWIIIEKYLFKFWHQFLEEYGIKGDRKDKLKNPVIWSIDYVLEILNFTNKLNKENYKILTHLKSRRNNLIHKGKRINEQDAKKCLEIVTSIIKHMI